MSEGGAAEGGASERGTSEGGVREGGMTSDIDISRNIAGASFSVNAMKNNLPGML